jgi:hypothetical protein
VARDQQADAAQQKERYRDPGLQQHRRTRRHRLPFKEQRVFLALHFGDELPDLKHQAEALVAVDDRERFVVTARFVGIDGGTQLVELVVDQMTQLTDLFDMLRVVAHQVFGPRQHRRQLIGGHLVGSEIAVASGNQIPALPSFAALHQTEHTRQLIAHRE